MVLICLFLLMNVVDYVKALFIYFDIFCCYLYFYY